MCIYIYTLSIMETFTEEEQEDIIHEFISVIEMKTDMHENGVCVANVNLQKKFLQKKF